MAEVKKRILLVDDSDLVAGMVSGYLEEAGFEVIRAVNGVDGVEKAYKVIPDMIVMDVEMPLLKGYQASRLLKSRRGVCDIPILMHTTLEEDRDKFWAYQSGVDEFTNKNFDNLGSLLEKVKRLSEHEPYDVDLIRRDGERVDSEAIFEMLSDHFDSKLFHANILTQLGSLVSNRSVDVTIEEVLLLFDNVCENQIALFIIRNRKRAQVFMKVDARLSRPDVEDFYNICLNDFNELFPEIHLDEIEPLYFGVDSLEELSGLLDEKKRISSYEMIELKGIGDELFGSFHVGNMTNNYFSPPIMKNIHIFTEGASSIIENILLYNQSVDTASRIREVFSKFVPGDIIDDLLEKSSVSALLKGEKREVAVLFSDIRSFTTISENNTPEGIVGFLNNYFEKMVTVITRNGGTIDKFIGDAILAIFGAPKSYEDNALRAVKAAKEMIENLPDVDVSGLNLPGKGFGIGIGIHLGPAIVGNIGSNDKFDYTVIGDTVNLASRLEGLTKHYKQKIIISESVKSELGESFLAREIDYVKVKGKDVPTSIFNIEVEPERFSEEIVRDYEKALTMYKMKNWETAIQYFTRASEALEGDFICEMFIKRCQDFLYVPPDENWDGAMDLDFK